MGEQVVCVIGTRAQLIKMAPVMQLMERRGLGYRLVLTGQHRATMRELLEEFGIRTPATLLYDGAEVSGIGRMLLWLPPMLWRLVRLLRRYAADRPQRLEVLVHGDTFSTLLGALAGRIAGGRVLHVESGLRSFNIWHPFPEELTRLAVFRLAQVAFCPGAWAAQNLAGRRGIRIVDTGENTLLDSVRFAVSENDGGDGAGEQAYCVASIHRFENIFNLERFRAIVGMLERIAEHTPVVFVLHPATQRRLESSGLYPALAANPGFRLVPRMTYVPFMGLVAGARFVVTDGGSNQEELSYLGIPALLMRQATERPEGLGRNVVLSNYDPAVVETFLAALPEGRRLGVPLGGSSAPSAVIVDFLAGGD